MTRLLQFLRAVSAGIEMVNVGRVLMVGTMLKIDCEGNDSSQNFGCFIVRGE